MPNLNNRDEAFRAWADNHVGEGHKVRAGKNEAGFITAGRCDCGEMFRVTQ